MIPPKPTGPALLEAILARMDAGQLRSAARLTHADTAAFVRAVARYDAPLQHVAPIVALGRAAAALVLLYGDPGLIDAVAHSARAALRDGSITLEDIYGRPDTT